MIDAFKKLESATVELDPFPYIVIEDVLPEEVCDSLIREMPPLQALTRGHPLGSNKRFNFTYADVVSSPDISPVWREVLSQAVSQHFLDRLLRLFGPSILNFYPDFEKRFAPISELSAELRSNGPASKPRWPATEIRRRGSIGLDAQIAVNTPALAEGTSVRTPHLDRTDKLFIGLLYLRLPEDDSQGADLELLKPKQDGKLVYGRQRLLPAEQTTHVRTIPYRKNTLVLFLNTPKSLHGVTPRRITRHTRYFINLVGETAGPLFEVEVTSEENRVAEPYNLRSRLVRWIRPGGQRPQAS